MSPGGTCHRQLIGRGNARTLGSREDQEALDTGAHQEIVLWHGLVPSFEAFHLVHSSVAWDAYDLNRNQGIYVYHRHPHASISLRVVGEEESK